MVSLKRTPISCGFGQHHWIQRQPPGRHWTQDFPVKIFREIYHKICIIKAKGIRSLSNTFTDSYLKAVPSKVSWDCIWKRFFGIWLHSFFIIIVFLLIMLWLYVFFNAKINRHLTIYIQMSAGSHENFSTYITNRIGVCVRARYDYTEFVKSRRGISKWRPENFQQHSNFYTLLFKDFTSKHYLLNYLYDEVNGSCDYAKYKNIMNKMKICLTFVS